MIDINTVAGFWYDGCYPMAELVDGSTVELSQEDAQRIFDLMEELASV